MKPTEIVLSEEEEENEREWWEGWI
jgi:hypothetical protein